MSKQEKRTPGLDELLMQLREENPKASAKELQKLFKSEARGNEDLIREAAEWFFNRNPALDATKKLSAAKKH
jgi:CRISPR/Cas system-associated protein Csm6